MPDPAPTPPLAEPSAGRARASVEPGAVEPRGLEPGPIGSRAQPARTTAGTLAGPLCLVLLAGLAMPPHHGLLVPLALALAMVVVGERRLRLLAEALPALSAGAGHPAARGALLLAALGSTAVLLTVLARGLGALFVELPASLWGAGAALLGALAWALVGGRLPLRARPVALVLLAAAIPCAGVVGTRHEAAGPHAHGWAHSGPILGIHPFQTTSILVDGHGPFDLPINDYVEPDGGRGYGPEALADALDRALASIADVVHPEDGPEDGPEGHARLRRALVDAEVEAVTTPAVWERLDREPHEESQPRFVVRSGSFGRGSRVEFVCPGRRIDPRGPQGETVMNRMCSDKYASEASAGLGVTGRWSGYSEARGQDRVGLHQLLGLTRGDDREGRRTLERETQLWAWIVLAIAALAVLVRPAAGVGEGLRGLGGALGALAVVAVVALAVLGAGEPGVGALPGGPSWAGWPSLAAWAPALALAALPLYALEGSPAADRGPAPRARTAILAGPAVLVVVATLALAACLPALAWIFPVHGAEGARLPAFVRGVADVIGEPAGLTIFEVEGVVASALAGLLLGGVAATAFAAVAAVERLSWRPAGARSSWRTAVVVLLVLAAAALLVVSRKTAGAAALVPGVVGVTLVLGGSLLRVARRRSPAAPRASLLGRSLAVAALLGWTALGAALVVAAVDPLPSHPFVTLCTVLGLLAVVAAGVAGALGSGERPDPDPALERPGGA